MLDFSRQLTNYCFLNIVYNVYYSFNNITTVSQRLISSAAVELNTTKNSQLGNQEKDHEGVNPASVGAFFVVGAIGLQSNFQPAAVTLAAGKI